MFSTMQSDILSKFICLLLCIAGAGAVYAYRMHVTVRDVTGAKLKCKTIFASEKDNNFIERAEYCPEDTTFIFNSLPEHPIFINTIIDNDTEDLWTGEQNEPQDSLSINLPIDYTSTQLSELVVNSDPRLITDDRTVYRPTSRQKKSAHDATGLLLSMNIPELKINPVSNTVTTIAGDGISYFIDYIPATPAQIENLRTSDVKSVEIFDSPSDPVFRGERHVVNFILVKYEYGGYTKLSASQYIVTPLTNYGISSRFSFRNFIFEAGLNGKFHKLSHHSSSTDNSFQLPSDELLWKETKTFDNTPSDSEEAYLMMHYGTKSFSMSHTIGLNHAKDRLASLSEINYSNPPLSPEHAAISQDSKGLSPYWQGNFQFIFPHGWDLTVDPSFTFADNSYIYDYGLPGNPIINNAAEDTYFASLHINGGKAFGNGHRLNLALHTNHQSFDIDYTGSSPAKINSHETEFNFSPSLSLNLRKVGLYLSAGIGNLNTSINSESQSDLLLRYYINANYRINAHHRLSFSSQLNYIDIPLNQKSPNIIMSNRLEAKQGNPDLKPTVYSRQSIQYLTFPLPWLSLSAFGRFDRYSRALAMTVTPVHFDNESITLLSSTENSGFQNILSAGMGANLSLLSDKLSFGFNASYSSMRRHGIYSMKDDFFTFSAFASYYLGNFYIKPFYSHSVNSYTNVAVTKYPSTYQIFLGWSNGNLNISAGARNFFRSSWKNAVTHIFGTDYSSLLTEYGGLSHRGFFVNLSYSFSYGKKIGQQDSNHPSNNIESGIVK